MRIISQNGYDFPYEQILVYLDERKICCKSISKPEGRYFLLGEYDTKERAKEVFREIQRTYKTCNIDCLVYVMPEE